MAELWDIYDRDRNLTGRTVERGQALGEGDYHLTVQGWIQNGKGLWLISRRSAVKLSYPLKWEIPGGAVLSGEDSYRGILREIKEEIGISVTGGELFVSKRSDKFTWECPGFTDVWVFRADFDISETVPQKEEVCEIKWAEEREIRSLISSGEFIPTDEFPYYRDLFEKYKSNTR